MTSALNRHPDYGFVLGAIVAAFLTAFATPSSASAQQKLSFGTVQGIVVDAATGAPLGRVLVEDVDLSRGESFVELSRRFRQRL